VISAPLREITSRRHTPSQKNDHSKHLITDRNLHHPLAHFGAAERANYVSFLNELCDLLGVPKPDPTMKDDERDAYVYERAVTFHNPDGTTSAGRIDLYKRGCFVLEAKQRRLRGTRGWDVMMQAARGQAEQYVRALPASEGNPPFLVVVDVGHTFELYSDFTRAGKTYVPFPDARTHRIRLEDLRREEMREQLRAVWTDPLALDPSRRSARVTREVAGKLADLARSLEESGHGAERTANFLMRAIFTMFAEDVQLIPAGAFTSLLEEIGRDGVGIFKGWSRVYGRRWTRAASRPSCAASCYASTADCSSRRRLCRWTRANSRCSSRPAARTGATWNRPSSGRCWSAH
jgi:hypothetical protein